MVLSTPTDSGRPSLEELARAARAGSDPAFSQLALRLQRPLYRFLLLHSGSAADAEELTQETFLRAWQAIERYDDRWRFTTWLYTIARRQAASLHRSSVRRRTVRVPDEFDSGEPDPISASAAAEQRSNLWDLASRVLSNDQRAALWLRYAEDMEPREIARVLGKGAGQLRVTLFRARRILARHLDRADVPGAPSKTNDRAAADVSPATCPEGT